MILPVEEKRSRLKDLRQLNGAIKNPATMSQERDRR